MPPSSRPPNLARATRSALSAAGRHPSIPFSLAGQRSCTAAKNITRLDLSGWETRSRLVGTNFDWLSGQVINPDGLLISSLAAMSPQTALQILARAVSVEDTDRAEVSLALATLEARAKTQWPFEQFRAALGSAAGDDAEKVGRRQMLNAALNAIRHALTV